MVAVEMKKYADMDSSALVQEISSLKRELFNLRFQKASGELANTARFRDVRVSIARAYTELSKQNKKVKG